jgi:hypothetical protein
MLTALSDLGKAVRRADGPRPTGAARVLLSLTRARGVAQPDLRGRRALRRYVSREEGGQEAPTGCNALMVTSPLPRFAVSMHF